MSNGFGQPGPQLPTRSPGVPPSYPGQPGNPGMGGPGYPPIGPYGPPVSRPSFKPIRGLGTAAIVFATLSTVGLFAALLPQTLFLFLGLSPFLDLPGWLAMILVVLIGAAWAASGCLAMAWLWRARQNAMLFAPNAPHALSPPWAVFGWIVPIVSYWFPVVMVRDVARATVRKPMGGLLAGWWATYVIGALSGTLTAQLIVLGRFHLGVFGVVALVALITTGIALVLWGSIIHIISSAQEERAPVMPGPPAPATRRATPVGAVAGSLAGVLLLTAGGITIVGWNASRSYSAYNPSSYPTDTRTTQPTTQRAATTGPPTRTQAPTTVPPPTTTRPTAKAMRVANTCGTDTHRTDCYLTVRSLPHTSGAEMGKAPEGATVLVVCQVRGERVSSSALGTSSDVWSRLESGGYVSSIFLDGGSKYSVETPC